VPLEALKSAAYRARNSGAAVPVGFQHGFRDF